MADAGEVKARVSIEYNGEGIKQAKEDLASLAEAAGGVGASAGNAGEGLSGLDEQLASNAESARGFSSALNELPRIVESGTSTIAEMSGTLSEHQAVIESTGMAYESLQKPVETTVSMLQEAAPPMQAIAKNAESMQTQVSMAGESFAQVGESISQSIPLLPQFAESMHTVSTSFDPKAFGLDDFVRNTEVFQEALSSPTPFTLIGQHLQETGQTWDDFTSSISEDSVAMLDKMAKTSDISYQVLDKASSGVQSIGQAFHESASSADEFTAQFNGVSESVGKASAAINEFGGVGEHLYGPLPKMAESIGFGEAFGNATTGLMGVLNDIAMPLMAVQMIGMAVQQVGQAMYNSAAMAEGPAAHSFGTFTGTVDALGQTIQRVGGQFSESFGQAIMPTLDILDAQFADMGGVAKAAGESIGGAIGIAFNLGKIVSGVDIPGGIQGLGAMFGLTSIPGIGPINANPMQAQIDQLNQAANNPQLLAAQASYQSAYGKAVQKQAAWDISHYAGTYGPTDPMNEILQAQVVRANGGVYGNVPEDPNLAWLDSLGIEGGGGEADFYNGSRTGPIGNSSSFPMSYGNEGYLNGGPEESQNGLGGISDLLSYIPAIGVTRALFGGGGPYSGLADLRGNIGGAFSNIGGFFGGIGQDFQNLWSGLFGGGNMGSANFTTGGCFVAGTPVLMADGTEKPIEMIRVDEQVLAHDGTKQIHAAVIGCIMFPAKQTYKLIFSNATVLLTTDSHPIATTQGWKSISPESTKRENPGLPVTTLEAGDDIYTADGTLCRLVSIQIDKITPVFNITVNAAHTYYANGILVHNAKASTIGPQIGEQASEQISGIQLPHMDLSGLSAQLGSNFSGIQLPHMDLSGLSAGLGGAFSGIPLPHLDLSGLTAGLGSAFSGISLPHLDLSGLTAGLSSAFTGISLPSIPDIGSQISSQLGSMFSGITIPSIPDIGGTISGALSGMFGGISMPSIPDIGGMISGAMSGMFGGIKPPEPPDVGAMISGAMSGMFGGITVPSPPDLGSMINSAMSGMFSGISIPSVPFFASGVSGFSGGAAVVGEEGTEVAEYNGRYALFDQGATFVNLPAGTSVYPMQDMANYSSPRMLANGTGGGGFTPISIGGGGNMPQSLNLHLQIGDAVISQIGIPLAANMRLTAGYRGY